MTTYEMLLNEASSLGLIVKEVNLITRKGRCVGNRIAIDKNIQTDAEKTCILREEIAHYKTTVGNITDQSDIVNIKKEKLARNIAVKNLCSLERIVNAIKNGAIDKYEVAECLHVTDDFFNEAIEYHRLKNELYYEFDDILIYFEPSFGVVKKDILTNYYSNA